MILQKELPVGIIKIEDNSEIEISKVVYDRNTERIRVYVLNSGDIPCFVYPEVELIVDGEEEILRVKKPIRVDPGDTKDARYRIKLTDADLAYNEEVSVHTLYGERENLLIKSLDGRYPLEVTGGMPITLITVAVIVVLIVGLLLWRFGRRKMG